MFNAGPIRVGLLLMFRADMYVRAVLKKVDFHACEMLLSGCDAEQSECFLWLRLR